MARHGATMMGAGLPRFRALVAEGDSITNNGGTSYYPNYTNAVASPALDHFTVTAVAGSTIADLSGRASTDDALKQADSLNMLSVLIGANDMGSGSAATYLSNLVTYLDARRAAGWKVLLCTVLPRSAASSAGFEAKRQTANAAIRGYPGVHCDAVCDFDTTVMGLFANTTDTGLYSDGEHPTGTGQTDLSAAFTLIVNGVQAGKTLPPAVSIAPGAYNTDQSVTLACGSPGAAMYYTLDNSTPTTSSTAYTGAFTLAGTATLKVLAVAPGLAASIVTVCDTTFTAADPVFSPVAANYVTTQSVTLTSATTGASIYYTIDGTTPDASKTLYTGAISVAADTTIKAIAIKTGYTSSSVATAAYTIGPAYITATGGTITTDGDYKVHTFTSSGTFQVLTNSGNVKYRVTAGGGGGGSFAGGGGGAGGVLLNAAFDYAVSVGNYTVTVGAGGNGAPDTTTASFPGGNSVFDTITATGGGRGETGGNGPAAIAAGNGGSGGGGGFQSSTAGTGIAGQGHNGGAGNGSALGAGGGGAGSAGSNASGSAGAGGTGVSDSIKGSAETRGVGGAGASNGGTGTAGSANTGNGGGGSYLTAGAAGGSGEVVIRYKFQ